MADIFDLNGHSFVANIDWRATNGVGGGNFRIGKACVAEIDRRKAILENVSFGGLPILADYVGKTVAKSRRALVVLASDDGELYFVGDFVQGIVNINTDLVISPDEVESVIEAKLSEMSYASPDIFIQEKVNIGILEGLAGLKPIEFSEDIIEDVKRVTLVGVSTYIVASSVLICALLAGVFFLLFVVARNDTPNPPFGTQSNGKLTKVTQNFAIDWNSFYEGCSIGLQQNFPRIAGWSPGRSGCFSHSMDAGDVGVDLDVKQGQGVAWLELKRNTSYNSLLSDALFKKAADEFGFSSVISQQNSYIYWTFPIIFKNFDVEAREDSIEYSDIFQFVLRRFAFELQGSTTKPRNFKSSDEEIKIVLDLPMQEFFQRLMDDDPFELNSFSRSAKGILRVSFVKKRVRKTIQRVVRSRR